MSINNTAGGFWAWVDSFKAEKRREPTRTEAWDAALKIDPTDAAMQRAAAELPEGWTIAIELERDSGSVNLFDEEHEPVEFYTDTETIAQQIHSAVDHARRSVG